MSLLANGIASSTRRTYNTAERRFISFCHQTRQLSPSGYPCPASEWTLMLFVSHLSESIKADSIKVYLAGVRSLHIKQGFPNTLENRLRLQRIVRGVKRLQGSEKRDRCPVTFNVLQKLQRQVVLTRYNDSMFWAACCLGFFGFLRSGEFTVASTPSFNPDLHLGLEDIKMDWHHSPTYMLVKIKASTTDQFRKGVTLRIATSGSTICAVRTLSDYLHLRGNRPGPLFVHADGKPLTHVTLSKWLQETALRAGLAGNFSGHSFRIGAVTTAAQNGVPDHLIKSLGRWESNAYQLYIKTPPNTLDNVAALLARVNGTKT